MSWRHMTHPISLAIFRKALKLLTLPLALVFATAPMLSSAEEEAKEPYPYLGDGHVDPGEDEAADLARAVQNPVADLISVPFHVSRQKKLDNRVV